MNVIFDTNAYRCFTYNLKDLPEDEKIRTVNQLKICLSKKGIAIRINFWVPCEILQHLCDVNDPGYKSCSETLEVMLRLSANEGYVTFNSMFEVALAHKFNNEEVGEHFKKLETNTSRLAVEFSEKGRTKVFEKYICDITDYIEAYKTQLYQGFVDAKVALKQAGHKSIPLDNDDLHLLVLLSRIKGILNIEPHLVEKKH